MTSRQIAFLPIAILVFPYSSPYRHEISRLFIIILATLSTESRKVSFMF